MKFALLIFTAAAFAATPSFARCTIDYVRWSWGQDASTSGRITGGGRCKMTFSTGHNSGIASLAISEPAKHGSASTNGSVAYPEVIYVPSKGYKGADDFAFTVTGGSSRGSGASKIRVSIDVQ